MVKLGVYLLARLNPLYQSEELWQNVLAVFGIATALTGAVLAFRETDLKRVLAYTTVTALGTLVMLIGIAPELSIVAAVTFLIVHAFYKAALFMVAGIVDHETGSRDASALRGLARVMPFTAAAATLAAFSMAGLPPFVGFVAKELIYEAKLELGAAAGPLRRSLKGARAVGADTTYTTTGDTTRPRASVRLEAAHSYSNYPLNNPVGVAGFELATSSSQSWQKLNDFNGRCGFLPLRQRICLNKNRLLD
jgi:NADH:ubiquinone oxidoreductase subunit 5 (subunit L)/multisubunit Na+/H+ antiporter MnhA subunit